MSPSGKLPLLFADSPYGRRRIILKIASRSYCKFVAHQWLTSQSVDAVQLESVHDDLSPCYPGTHVSASLVLRF